MEEALAQRLGQGQCVRMLAEPIWLTVMCMSITYAGNDLL